MLNRRRSVAVLLMVAALGASSLPAGRALYSPHSGVVSADPADGTPHVLDDLEFPVMAGERIKVNAIVPMGDRIYVGGTFTGVKNSGESTKLSRRGLFALDAATHKVIENFAVEFNGAIEALAPAPDGKSIFAAGRFSTVNGLDFPKLARIDVATGAPMAGFRPRPDAEVKDIAVAGDRLFLVGPFGAVKSTPRAGLAAVDINSGNVDTDVDIQFSSPRSGTRSRVESIAVTPDGKTLVAGGNFTRVDGQERWQLALLDVTEGRSASLLNWKTNRLNDTKGDPADPFICAEAFDTHVKDLDIAPDGSYFVLVTTGGYTRRGPLCDTASRWETAARGSDVQPTWANYVGGDTLTGVAVTGTAVYVGGHFRWLNNYFNDGSASDAQPGRGSVEREGIAALDPDSGLPLPWNPRRERGHGPEAFASTGDGLWVGSDTDFIGQRNFDGVGAPGERHPKLAFFPLAGGAAAHAVAPQGLPADLYTFAGGTMGRAHFDGAALSVPQALGTGWTDVRGAFAVGTRLYTADKDGSLYRYAFDGVTMGPRTEVNLRGLDAQSGNEYFNAGFRRTDVESITGIFYSKGRIYYTKRGNPDLFYRSFLSMPNVADDIVGDIEYKAGGDGNWSKVEGMTMAAGSIYWAEGADLYRMAFDGSKPTGSRALVKKNAGLASAGMFLMPATGAPPAGPFEPPAPEPPGQPPITQPGAVLRSGYWMVGNDGAVYAFGEARHLGDAIPHLGSALAVDLEPTPTNGYWIVDDQGRVFGFGDARHHGNVDRSKLAKDEKITSLSATPSGGGYWIFTTRGRAIAFGDAGHHGDMVATRLNAPVLDSIPTPSGKGYYMVAGDGGIFTFGDAKFYGSTGNMKLNQPVQSLVPDPDGKGYWLVASDGGVFTFETAFKGSMGSTRLNKPMTGMVPYGNGYLMVAEDGGIFNFSNLEFAGSLGNNPPARPVVSVASVR